MKQYFEKIIRPHNQAILILITSILLLSLTLISLYRFENLDTSPSIQPIEQLKKYNKNLETIPTGIYIRNFIDFDIIKNDFTIEAIVWFIIDPSKISIESLGKFYFSKGLFIKTTMLTPNVIPLIKNLKDGKQMVEYDVRIKFSSNLNYRLFPLDSHRLYLTLTNKHISAEKFYFDIEPDNYLVSKTLYTFGWTNIRNDVKTGYTEFPLCKSSLAGNPKYPRIVVSMDFLLSSLRNILLIFMPLFVVFFLSLFSFSFDPSKNRETIMSISAAVVPAILAYRFVIEAMSPKVTYFILSDQIFNMFLLLAFFIFFINEFYLVKIKEYRGLLVLSFHLILIISWYYLLFIWV